MASPAEPELTDDRLLGGRLLLISGASAEVIGVLRRSGTAAQRNQWLPGIIDGSTQAALAFAAVAFLMVFERFIFRYVSTMPPAATSSTR